MARIDGISTPNGDFGHTPIFQDVKFFVPLRVPQRNKVQHDIRANGGGLAALEKHANYKLADPERDDCPPGSISYEYVAACIGAGQLLDASLFGIQGVDPGARPVGSKTRPKQTRQFFSPEDDRVLHEWVSKCIREGKSEKGNLIFKQLESKNTRHPWQSWRDRYVRYVSLRPPLPGSTVATSERLPSPEEPDQVRIESDKIPSANDKIARGTTVIKNEITTSAEGPEQGAIEPNDIPSANDKIARTPLPRPTVQPPEITEIPMTPAGVRRLEAEASALQRVPASEYQRFWKKFASEWTDHSADEWRTHYEEKIVPTLRESPQPLEIQTPSHLKRPIEAETIYPEVDSSIAARSSNSAKRKRLETPKAAASGSLSNSRDPAGRNMSSPLESRIVNSPRPKQVIRASASHKRTGTSSLFVSNSSDESDIEVETGEPVLQDSQLSKSSSSSQALRTTGANISTKRTHERAETSDANDRPEQVTVFEDAEVPDDDKENPTERIRPRSYTPATRRRDALPAFTGEPISFQLAPAIDTQNEQPAEDEEPETHGDYEELDEESEQGELSSTHDDIEPAAAVSNARSPSEDDSESEAFDEIGQTTPQYRVDIDTQAILDEQTPEPDLMLPPPPDYTPLSKRTGGDDELDEAAYSDFLRSEGRLDEITNADDGRELRSSPLMNGYEDYEQNSDDNRWNAGGSVYQDEEDDESDDDEESARHPRLSSATNRHSSRGTSFRPLSPSPIPPRSAPRQSLWRPISRMNTSRGDVRPASAPIGRIAHSQRTSNVTKAPKQAASQATSADLQSFIRTCLANGHDQADVLEALRRTTMDSELTMRVLEQIRARGWIGLKMMPGVWTVADDAILSRGGDAANGVRAFHGEDRCVERLKALIEWSMVS